MESGYFFQFTPLLKSPWLIGLGCVLALLLAALLYFRPKGFLWRCLALCLCFFALFDPSLVQETREKLEDVVAVIVDRSASQNLDQRRAQTDQALAGLKEALNARPKTKIREIEIAENEGETEGTRLFSALTQALSDLPRGQLSGIIALTDGIVHDVPKSMNALGFHAPFHALITGKTGEFDRRLELVEAPRFGIVGRDVSISLKATSGGENAASPPQSWRLTLRQNGEALRSELIKPGETLKLSAKIDRAGLNLIEASIENVAGELTTLNNLIVIPIEGVREKLRVLLISGEPHAGERTWRNLLKADANVDLVHFTILRPPEKQDSTPVNELALIAFPTRELFSEKIGQFDLIIFDRYSNQTYLPTQYFENMVHYVREGGAILFAPGPELLLRGGLTSTPLMQLMPARPAGRVYEEAFLPKITKIGERHPVTRKLEGAPITGVLNTGATPPNNASPQWGAWLRQLASTQRSGEAVMSGINDQPLLILQRQEKGRVAMLLSDHAWLWARGFQGGGPYLDLLRRVAHWLMKEPELEEETLRLKARGKLLTLERRSLRESISAVKLTSPDGQITTLTLDEKEPGVFSRSELVNRFGLYKAEMDNMQAFVTIGPANPKEFAQVVSTEEILKPIASETGGSTRRIFKNGTLDLPRIVDIRSGKNFGGEGYIGLKPSEASNVSAIKLNALGLGGLGLLLFLLPLLLTWWREGKRRRD